MSRASYSYFEHTADIGLEARSPDLAGAFAAAAAGMCALIVDPSSVQRRHTWSIRVGAPDLETLLVRWLNEVLFRMETSGQVFAGFEVSLAFEAGPAGDVSHTLRARAHGEKLDPGRHRPQREIKAATYHGLHVGVDAGAAPTIAEESRYLVRVIFDL